MLTTRWTSVVKISSLFLINFLEFKLLLDFLCTQKSSQRHNICRYNVVFSWRNTNSCQLRLFHVSLFKCFLFSSFFLLLHSSPSSCYSFLFLLFIIIFFFFLMFFSIFFLFLFLLFFFFFITFFVSFIFSSSSPCYSLSPSPVSLPPPLPPFHFYLFFLPILLPEVLIRFILCNFLCLSK